ncbi:MAG TPA: hypothetical protein PLE77_12175 [Kiritimatiellia bacterium]|nr:hypothetical protein [Kiritimatiellia bacterium]
MKRIAQLWRGEVKLWKTFWIFGIVVPVLFSIASALMQVFFVRLWKPSIVVFALGGIAISVVYTVYILVAIWRSAGKHAGIKVWAWCARVYVIACISVTAYVTYSAFSEDRNDRERNSYNIESIIQADDAYPYIGFWKGDCGNNFGLAIEKAEDGLYSVSFSGPGGGFMPGKYRPHTLLTNDPNYRIVDANTIEVQGAGGFTTYVRCPGSKFYKEESIQP